MDTMTLTIAAVVVAVIGVVAVIVVAVRADGRLTARSLLLPGAVVVVATVLASLPAESLARSSKLFSVAHLAYLVVGIALPAVGVALLVAGAVRRATWPVWVVAVALLVPAPVTWYGTHVAPYRLGVERAEVDLPDVRSGSDPIRIGVLSDIQTTDVTSYEHRVVTELLALDPDIIVLPGDIFQGSEEELRAELGEFRRLLGRLEAPGGVYAVRGDVDTGDRLDELLVGTDIEILDYEIETTKVGDRTVQIGGNKLLWAPIESVEMRADLVASDPSDVRILVSHRPDVVLSLPPSSDVDLTVAGHTHGGQVALPFIGPPVTFTSVPRSVARGGLHEVGGNRIFVSSGVGMARLDAPQVRLFTRPAVGLVILR